MFMWLIPLIVLVLYKYVNFQRILFTPESFVIHLPLNWQFSSRHWQCSLFSQDFILSLERIQFDASISIILPIQSYLILVEFAYLPDIAHHYTCVAFFMELYLPYLVQLSNWLFYFLGRHNYSSIL